MNAILPASFKDFAIATGQSLTSEIVVDSFAGGGGASLGIERALVRLRAMGLLDEGDPNGVNIAINHDAAAIEMHQANHPKTLHLRHDIWRVDPLAATSGYAVGLLWASPDCRHHSKAKGGRPVSASVRDLAWVVAHWAEQVLPRQIYLENVEEFRDWGPLVADRDGNMRPDKLRKGATFKRWIAKFRRLGYRVEWREIRARVYGAPTIRKRLYIIMRRDGEPIVWPAPTHGAPDSPEVKAGKLKPWPVAADIIDFTLPCPSVLMTREGARAFTKATGIRIQRPLAYNSEARIAYGVKRYLLEAAQPFIVTCNHAGGGFRGQGLDESFVTVARARDAHGLVQAEFAPFLSHGQHGGRSRPGNDSTHTIAASRKDTNQLVSVFVTKHMTGAIGSGPGESLPTVTANSFVKRPGGAVPLGVSAVFLAQHNTDMVGHDMRESVSTIVGKASTQSVVAASMISFKGSERRDYPVTRSIEAINAQGGHAGIIVPFMTAYYGSDEVGSAGNDSLRTVTGKARFGHVEVEAAPPPLSEEQLARARQVAAFLRKYGCWDQREFVTVGPYIVVDIGMRMLTPRELARAQGFPDDYDITAGGRLNETQQRHKIGNSVCPDVAEALVFANYRPVRRAPPKPDQGWLFERAAA
ncbi:DNA methyltransferase [Devosia sp. D6-9]|nr:DNA methyltransferase [Devosia sp. D6-9]